ncbi:unnamed protein product [Rotaria sp. Silwood2]|nr:unnamed protein product [Rotaria sp. Silwood2]CAF4300369.1 unnamed protein product [Rotaria sp. Silwood2]
MPSQQLQSTLSDTLNYFPILAGRITEDTNGNAIVHLTNEGVLFTEARCNNQKLDYFIQQTADIKEFDYENINSSDLSVLVTSDWTGPMLSIQLTRLQCGSVILSLSAFHCLMDAQSTAHFMNTWASGGKFKSYSPMTDKSFVLLPSVDQPISRPLDCVYNRNMDLLSRSPFVQTPRQHVICKVYHFSTSELKNIKEEAMKGLTNRADYISTYDSLYAHIILVINKASQPSLNQNKKIKILQPFNGRSRFVPSHSQVVLGYFGCFVFWIYEEVPIEESLTLSSLAQTIHNMYSKQDENSLRYYNAYLSSDDGNIRKNRVDADICNCDFHCTSWRKVDMLEASFHGNDSYPIFNGPTKYRGSRFCIMMDANRNDESINVVFGLKEQEYERMLEQNLLHKYR